ncbi:MAG: putative metalloprotease CJM1_0395 family protein, partial [Planctomycetota bacterium]
MSIDGVNSTPRAIGPGAANRLINLMGVHRGQSAHGAAPVRNSADIPDTVVPAIDAIDRDSLVIEAIRPPVVDTIQFTSTATSSAGDAALPPAAHAAVDPTRGSQPGSTASHPWDPRQAYAQGAAAEPSRAGPAETAAGANAASAQTGQTPANSATGQTAATPADQAAPQVTPNTGPGKQVELTAKEQEQVERLVKGDAEIRRHEEAHVAAAGSLRVSGPHYEYATGPDDQRYAIAGVVNIDTTPVKGDPEATIAKMQQVRRAALAPESPSAADRAVARQASRYEAEARRELAAMAGLQSGEDSDQTTGRTSDAETT